MPDPKLPEGLDAGVDRMFVHSVGRRMWGAWCNNCVEQYGTDNPFFIAEEQPDAFKVLMEHIVDEHFPFLVGHPERLTTYQKARLAEWESTAKLGEWRLGHA